MGLLQDSDPCCRKGKAGSHYHCTDPSYLSPPCLAWLKGAKDCVSLKGKVAQGEGPEMLATLHRGLSIPGGSLQSRHRTPVLKRVLSMDPSNTPMLQMRRIRPGKRHVAGCVQSRLEAERRLDSGFVDSCSGAFHVPVWSGESYARDIPFRAASVMWRPIFTGHRELGF